MKPALPRDVFPCTSMAWLLSATNLEGVPLFIQVISLSQDPDIREQRKFYGLCFTASGHRRSLITDADNRTLTDPVIVHLL